VSQSLIVINIWNNLDDIKTKIVAIGLGWYGGFGIDGFNHTLYESYKYTEKTRLLLDRIEKDSVLSCRDLLSVRSLKNNGYKNILMTGCPAWYDIENINKTTLRDGINLPYKKICISDPGNKRNTDAAYKVTEFLRKKYPEAHINFVFHRGIHHDKLTDKSLSEKYEELVGKLEKLGGVDICDISYGTEGFKIYDDCDIHIGFRVHAHIYNLSKRNISLLIEEDGRGAGQNEVLGLPRLKTVEDKGEIPYMKYGIIGKIVRWLAIRFEIPEKENRYLINNIDDALYVLENNDYMIMENAFCLQKKYFDVMSEYLKETICKQLIK